MPVVTAQRPVQHHKPPWQAAIGERSLQPKRIQRIGKGSRWSNRRRGMGSRCRELAHHHPGGGLHGLPAEKRVCRQSISRWSTGFIPGFTGLPPPTERCLRQGDQLAQITAVDPDAAVQSVAFAIAFQLQALNAITPAINPTQATTGPPLEQWLRSNPALQQTLSLFRPESETADPVLIKAFGHAGSQGSDELPPEPRLPAAQFMAIRGTHPGGTEHSPQPRPWGQQQRPRT